MKSKLIKIGTPIACIVLYIMYMYYYQGEISIGAFINHTVGSLNIFTKYINTWIDKLTVAIFEPEVLKVIVTVAAIAFITKKVDFAKIFKHVKDLEFGDFKISMQEMIQNKKDIDEEIDNLEKNSENANEEELDIAKKKSELIQIMIDNENIITVIEKYLRTSRTVIIPLNIIPSKVKLTEISKIFEYEKKSNSIKIIRIKKDLEPILIDVYSELKEKNTICTA